MKYFTIGILTVLGSMFIANPWFVPVYAVGVGLIVVAILKKFW